MLIIQSILSWMIPCGDRSASSSREQLMIVYVSFKSVASIVD